MGATTTTTTDQQDFWQLLLSGTSWELETFRRFSLSVRTSGTTCIRVWRLPLIHGVHVDRVEIKDVRLPQQMQRAMAAEAESTRDARAKVIASEGEQKAAKALKEAADVISQSPAALQLRYLQTLNSISAEKNSTIIFPLPMELVGAFTDSDRGVRKRNVNASED